MNTYVSGVNVSGLRVDRELRTFAGRADECVRDSATIVRRILVERFDLMITRIKNDYKYICNCV